MTSKWAKIMWTVFIESMYSCIKSLFHYLIYWFSQPFLPFGKCPEMISQTQLLFLATDCMESTCCWCSCNKLNLVNPDLILFSPIFFVSFTFTVISWGAGSLIRLIGKRMCNQVNSFVQQTVLNFWSSKFFFPHTFMACLLPVSSPCWHLLATC